MDPHNVSLVSLPLLKETINTTNGFNLGLTAGTPGEYSYEEDFSAT